MKTGPIKSLVIAAVMLGATTSAYADYAGLGPGPGLTGNSTGGIITWSPWHQHIARHWAAYHCAQYGEIARITSVHARYGDYIGFSCRFPRYRRW